MPSMFGIVAGIAVVLLGAGTSPGTGTTPSDGYRTEDLGTLGGPDSTAAAINDRGQVAGWSTTLSGQPHAFRWQYGHLVDLATLDPAPNDWSLAEGINARGDVVGGSRVGDQTHAVLWRGRTITDLGTLGGGYSIARAVDDHGVIVGNSETATGETHGFVWRDGVMRDLGLAGETVAEDVDDSGVVVGWTNPGGEGPNAFRWRDGAATLLGDRGSGSLAHAVNARGDIVGALNVRRPPALAVRWRSGTPYELGNLPGGNASTALAVNDRGEILGTGNLAPHSLDEHAFVWSSGTFRDLAQFGIGPTVTDINNRGQITGRLAHGDGAHAAVFTPR